MEKVFGKKLFQVELTGGESGVKGTAERWSAKGFLVEMLTIVL